MPDLSQGADGQDGDPASESATRLMEALRPFAELRADDGDTFDDYPDGVILRCEVSVGEIKQARAAIAMETQRAETVKQGSVAKR